jgi:hypothetical protein
LDATAGGVGIYIAGDIAYGNAPAGSIRHHIAFDIVYGDRTTRGVCIDIAGCNFAYLDVPATGVNIP